MKNFDIYPFSLPNTPKGEIRFEEPRDIVKLIVSFTRKTPDKVKVYYLRKTWPQIRIEYMSDLDNPCAFGWIAQDDWFNGKWQEAAIIVNRLGPQKVEISFKDLVEEFPDMKDYNVLFRRTLGVKLDETQDQDIKSLSVFTTSSPARTLLEVRLDAGRKTPGKSLGLKGYNALIKTIIPIKGISVKKNEVKILKASSRIFKLDILHMKSLGRYFNDDGHITFETEKDAFTISLASLELEGPIWYADKGIFIKKALDPVSFEEYRESQKNSLSISGKVKSRPEQSYACAFSGQPRAHAVSYNLACKHARQRFWLESNGDVLLNKSNVTRINGRDTPLYKNKGSARFFFGLEKWASVARFPDPEPVLVYNILMKKDALWLEQKSFAVPLLSPDFQKETKGDDPIVALVRFRFQNRGDKAVVAELPIHYSQDSRRTFNPLMHPPDQDDNLVPKSVWDKLYAKDRRITSLWKDQEVLRLIVDSKMEIKTDGLGIKLVQTLEPGKICDALLKIPFISLETVEEQALLQGLQFDDCCKAVTEFWQKESRRGAALQTPEPHLNALHASHLAHVLVTDFAMPDGSGLVNTSVGTSTYGNFSNESCMIVQELDQRGLHEEAGQRLELWIRYQGTASQPGNFTDYDGMFFGAGGFEDGAYNQHHGWVLWCLCEHFFLSGNESWFRKVADSVIAGADWIFRQRRSTMKPLPHSRGWEYGFLPAGSLEDVTDFHYWLSTNALSWRGTDWAARALEKINHSEAPRVRREADAYRKDLLRGFETIRKHSPLVRLRSGRWIPHYPSRLYRRGRDVGWIRETLEGAVYLLISGLYDVHSHQASWILEDYHDNRYPKPPYGYLIPDFEENWFDRAGFSMQPNLLAGLLPHLERDEIEIYIWMFFNAWCACYREEINAMVEHPAPVLGYSNSAHFKTSDEANAIMWLRYIFVYASIDLLHLGRAIPREWFKGRKEFWLLDVCTHFGKVGVCFRPQLDQRKVEAEIALDLFQDPGRILVRFRHPEKLKIRSVAINGKTHEHFDPRKGDVDITGYKGRILCEVHY